MYQTYSLQMIRSLLFGASGDDGHPDISPLSKAPGDIAKVRVIRRDIGQLTKECDTKEEYFHIELYDTHAEVWLAFEWAESNARHKAWREKQALDRAEHDTKASLAKEIADALIDKLPAAFVKQVATEIAKHYKANEFDALLEKLEIKNIVKKYKENT